MLLLSFIVLLIVSLVGTALAAPHLRAGNPGPPRWPLGAAHGLLGIAGLAALLLALRGPQHGVAMGVGGFGRIAAVLLTAALLAGLAVLTTRLRHRHVPGLLIGIHATLAVSGVVVLAAYTLVG